MKATTSDSAVLFRTFHAMVPDATREELYQDILGMSLGKDLDFEKLTVKVLAMVAAGKIPTEAGVVCSQLLTLVLHSLTLSRMQRDGKSQVEVASAVTTSLKDAKRQLKQLERDADIQPSLTMADLEKTADKARFMVIDNGED